MKALIRSTFPSTYHKLWQFKQLFMPRRWGKYYAADTSYEWMSRPNKELLDIKLPAYIDTILDLGCASGRNFLPFDGKLKLWGLDIVPESDITWLRPFKNLTYEHSTIERFTRRLEKRPIDLSHVFVFTSGTLMYVSRKEQERFLKACLNCGCKNFMFREFRPDSKLYPKTNFKLPEEWFTFVDDEDKPDDIRIYTFQR